MMDTAAANETRLVGLNTFVMMINSMVALVNTNRFFALIGAPPNWKMKEAAHRGGLIPLKLPSGLIADALANQL